MTAEALPKRRNKLENIFEPIQTNQIEDIFTMKEEEETKKKKRRRTH